MTKRADHESSIYRDAADRWHGWVSMGGVRPDGKPDRRHVSARTRKEVVLKVRELEKKRDAGVAHTAGRQMIFGDCLDHRLTIFQAQRASEHLRRLRGLRPQPHQALGHHRL